MFLAFALALFLPAGTLAWPAGWIFLVLFFGFVIAVSLWLLRHNPGLLKERMNGVIQTGQKAWDQAIIIVTGGLFFAWLILMPLDAVRFHWSQDQANPPRNRLPCHRSGSRIREVCRPPGNHARDRTIACPWPDGTPAGDRNNPRKSGINPNQGRVLFICAPGDGYLFFG